MKNTLLAALTLLSLCLAAAAFAADAPTPGWECSRWADGTYDLYCGGAFLKKYRTALECVAGKKEICGASLPDFQCSRWPDGNYDLYCGGAFIKRFPTALACVKGKRSICD